MANYRSPIQCADAELDCILEAYGRLKQHLASITPDDFGADTEALRERLGLLDDLDSGDDLARLVPDEDAVAAAFSDAPWNAADRAYDEWRAA